MGVSRFTVSLRFWHPSIDPSEITLALGLEPKRAVKAGDARTTPKGTPLSGIFRETYWYVNMAEGYMPPQELAGELDQLLNKLMPHRPFFERIRAQGGRSEFSIGFWLGGQAGETYPTVLLAKMAALGLDLSLDNYHDKRMVVANDE